ncbi:hypothetical protein HID58_059842 [Brassica napus]|uniref:Replication factor A C-terminal domain-containing protein n=1 Tax=Brassica napus TaxID=3708 RepID=A0ABQ7ZUV4_BRANA|nr:hypothetical protein HID58_059842 [Brassica napus]
MIKEEKMQQSQNCKICGNEAIHSCRIPIPNLKVLFVYESSLLNNSISRFYNEIFCLPMIFLMSSEIVIGSGISARNLSEASINVTVLESHDRICGRSTLISPLVVLLIWELLGYMESPTTPLGSYYTPSRVYFIYKVQILEVLSQNGWYYVSCTRCSKKLDRSAASLRCNQCVNHNVTNVVKYHVELLVDDGNNYATFVVFDKEMLKLAKQDAAALLLDEVNSGVGKKLKAELGGTDLDFHIRVTPHNFSPDHCTFTVSAASDSFNTESCNINETPFVEGKCGDASTSASASNTSTADVKGGRIHPRE